MKKPIPILSLILLALTGCASSFPDGPLPYATNDRDAARVYILRSDEGVFWAVLPLNVTFDSHVIARLGTGEYVNFSVDYGFHDLGISDHTIQFPFERGRTYYFIIAPDESAFGFGITLLGPEQSQRLLQTYQDVNAVPVSIYN